MEQQLSNIEKLKNAHTQALNELIEQDAQNICDHELEKERPSVQSFYTSLSKIPWISHLDNTTIFSKQERENVLADALVPVLNTFSEKTNTADDKKTCFTFDNLQERYLAKIQGIPVSIYKTIKAQTLCELSQNYCKNLAQSTFNEIIPQLRTLLNCGPTVGMSVWLLKKHPGLTFTTLNNKKFKLTSVNEKIQKMNARSFSATKKQLYQFLDDEALLCASLIKTLLDETLHNQELECCNNIMTTLNSDIKNYDQQLRLNIKDLLDKQQHDKQLDALNTLLENYIKALPEPSATNRPELIRELLHCSAQCNTLFETYINKKNPLDKQVNVIDVRNKDDRRKLLNAQKINGIALQFNSVILQNIGAALAHINKYQYAKREDGTFFPQPLNDMYWSYKIADITQQKGSQLYGEYHQKKKSRAQCINDLECFEKSVPQWLKNIKNTQYQNITKMMYGDMLIHIISQLHNN